MVVAEIAVWWIKFAIMGSVRSALGGVSSVVLRISALISLLISKTAVGVVIAVREGTFVIRRDASTVPIESPARSLESAGENASIL